MKTDSLIMCVRCVRYARVPRGFSWCLVHPHQDNQGIGATRLYRKKGNAELSIAKRSTFIIDNFSRSCYHEIGITNIGKELRKMATKKSEIEAKSNAKHSYRVSLKFNKVHDMEIVLWLKKQVNKQEAIKNAIMFYMQNYDE